MEQLLLSLLTNEARMSLVLLCLAITHLYKRSADCDKKHAASEKKYKELLSKLAIHGCIQRDCPKQIRKHESGGAGNIAIARNAKDEKN